MSNFAAGPTGPAAGAAGVSAAVEYHAVARAVAASGSVAAAVAVWLAFRTASVVPEVPTGLEQQVRPLGVGPVLAASLSAALASWVLALFVEHRAARPRLVWTAVALPALALSLLPIASVEGGAEKLALVCMHSAVAAVLLAGMVWTLPAARR